MDLPDDVPSGQRSRIQSSYSAATVTVTDQVGRKRKSQVDGLGRLTSITEMNPSTGLLDSTNYLTTYTYDTLDNLTGVNQGGQTRGFTYDSLSRVMTQTTPEGGTVGFTYTDFGSVLKRTDARNVETHYKYDSLNRVTQVWYTGLGGDDAGTTRPALPAGIAPTSQIDIAYNTATPGNGALSSITDGQITGFSASESYSYDSLGRTTSKTRTIDGNGYATQYQYNQINQLRLMIYPSGKRVRENFDSRGRFSGEDKVDSADSVLTSYVSGIGYNVASQVTGMTSGSGVNEVYTYSSDRLQLTRQTATKSGSTLMDLNYSYAATALASGVGTTAGNSGQLMALTTNPSSQPSTINGQTRNQAFTYDDLARLVTTTGWSTWQRRFAYDRWANRTGVWDATSGGTQIQSVTLQQQPGAPAGVPSNRATTITKNGMALTQTYDAAGNLTGDGAHSYQYDAENRIAKVDAGTLNEADYFYDAGNRRVKKITSNNAYTTYCIWEGGKVIAEYSNAPAGATGNSYYLADRLSNRMITDTNGAFRGTQDHLPFGEEGGTTGVSETHRFTNYERDTESGTDYAVNRQLAMGTGRFMTPDPVGGLFGAPQSFNRYAYTLNDPINLTDPFGLYEACVHRAMTQYIARKAGLSAGVAKKLGKFAGDGPGGADSDEFKATTPTNQSTWAIHFPTEEQLDRFKSTFWGDISTGTRGSLINAGHTLHSIEDGHGAHKDYINSKTGHALPNILDDGGRMLLGVALGTSPDRIIGDNTFVDVSNELLQFLTKDPNARLTSAEMNELIDAILKECQREGFQVNKLVITRPQTDAPQGGGAYFGGFGASPFANWDIFDLLGLSEGTVTSTYKLEPPDEE